MCFLDDWKAAHWPQWTLGLALPANCPPCPNQHLMFPTISFPLHTHLIHIHEQLSVKEGRNLKEIKEIN